MENTGSNKKIFREKSMEQLSTPEQLTGYLRVTGPGVWIVLAGLAILLAGLLVWGIFGRLVSTVTVPAKVENGKAYCYVLQDDLRLFDKDAGKKNADSQAADSQNAGSQAADKQGTGKKDDDMIGIIIGDVHMEADPKDAVTATLDSSSEPELYSSGYLSAGKNVVILTCDTTLKDGFYNAEVVTDELKPITLLFSDK